MEEHFFNSVVVFKIPLALAEFCKMSVTCSSNNAVTTIAEVSDEGLGIYPNPASLEVKIISNGDANVKIFDMTGRCVKDVDVTENATIDIKDLNTGVYFVNVNGKVEKLVIE